VGRQYGRNNNRNPNSESHGSGDRCLLLHSFIGVDFFASKAAELSGNPNKADSLLPKRQSRAANPQLLPVWITNPHGRRQTYFKFFLKNLALKMKLYFIKDLFFRRYRFSENPI